MSYILKLVSWYPSKLDEFNGDFVQRHAKSIALYEKTIVVYVVKSTIHHKIKIEQNQQGNLTEYIGYYPQKKWFPVLQSQWQYFVLYKKLLLQIIANNGLPKLIHLNIVWKAGIMALYLKRKFGLNYIITENWTGYYKEDPNFIGNSNFIKKYFVKKVFQKATYFLPVTRNLAITCNQLFKTNLPFIVVENAVDTNFFYANKNNSDKITLMHISTMGYQKNTSSLLACIEKVIEKTDIDFTTILIGPYTQNITDQIEDSAVLAKNIILTGNIPYIEVANYVKNSSMLVLFSRYENLPCVILEALCCGVPVISTAVGGINEVIHSANGLLVPNNDTQALENAILQSLQNVKQYNKNDISKDAIFKYSYQAIGKKYVDAYAVILKQTASS